ncbi:MAG TPA: type II secretion system F family protein [Vicinamibacterales bacterium]|nr:type II secretion system F family protein [Vicinamibacterales bacterium]
MSARVLWRSRRVSSRTLAIFTRQFSVMIDAGLPLVQCLELLGKDEPDPRLAGAVNRVRADVGAGASLADAMRRHPRVFDELYTNMVAAGEAGGILDTILNRLSTFIEKQARLNARVRAALIYPACVLTIAVLVVVVILVKVIPTFSALFDGLGASLPWATRLVIWASEKTSLALPAMVAAALAGSFLTRRYYLTAAGSVRLDGWRLRLPLLGPITRKVAVARFCRTLGTLLTSGVPILDGLDITARTAGNAVIEQAVRRARGRIERGETIAAPLRSTGAFPVMVAQMIGAGESTGALDTMLGKIADVYEDEVDIAVAALLSVLEPALIVILGGLVGGIVISMYLPLFELVEQLS